MSYEVRTPGGPGNNGKPILEGAFPSLVSAEGYIAEMRSGMGVCNAWVQLSVGTRVSRKCWPSNVGVVRSVKSLAHLPGVTNPGAHTLLVEWDDRPGELFEEVGRDVEMEAPGVYACAWKNHLGQIVHETTHAWFQPSDKGPRQCAMCRGREEVPAGPPLEPGRTPVSSSDAPQESATLLRDRRTSRSWLEFATKPSDATIAALKAEGWRFSGYRKAWHNPRKGIAAPSCVAAEDGGECDYSAERGDRLDAAAGKAQARSDAARDKAAKIADQIPLGQPILVGHHSEKRSRRDAERIRSGFEKSMEEGAKARELSTKAAASRAHQEHTESAPVIQRRLEKLRADLRSLDARKQHWGAAALPDWQRKRDALAAEVTKAEKDLTDAGGPVVAECKVGDTIRIRGHVVRVDRVNAKTISGTISAGGAKGMTGKWDKTWFQEIIAQAEGSLPASPAPANRAATGEADSEGSSGAMAPEAARPLIHYNEGKTRGLFPCGVGLEDVGVRSSLDFAAVTCPDCREPWASEELTGVRPGSSGGYES